MTSASATPVDFQAVFERSPGLYLLFDRDLRAVAVTDAFCARSWRSRESLVGLSFEELFAGHADNPGSASFERLKASLERVIRTHRSDLMPVQRYDLRSRDGGFIEKYWSPRNSPILGEDGDVQWIIHRVYDVTDAVLNPAGEGGQRKLALSQERLVVELQRNNEELAQLDVLRARLMEMSRLSTMATMASALAHDVSQPLTAARNYLGALKRVRADGGEDKIDDLVAKIGQQVERAGEIVKSLRSFMAEGNTVQQIERIGPVIADAARLAGSKLKSVDAKLVLDIAPDLPPVEIDRIQIQQVIVNLLVAAAESVDGCQDRDIALRAVDDNGAVRIVIADKGADRSATVRGPSGERSATNNLMGAGLGLAIAQQIVAEHRGTVAMAPNLPSGAIFSVTLPGAAAAAEGAA